MKMLGIAVTARLIVKEMYVTVQLEHVQTVILDFMVVSVINPALLTAEIMFATWTTVSAQTVMMDSTDKPVHLVLLAVALTHATKRQEIVSVGSYGNFCNQSCPAYCKNNVCNIENGQCTECEAGFYGTECNQSCPENCQDTLCHRSSGECEVCVAGFYGSQCSELCGNCQGVSCDKDMGDCAIGCTEGWTGDTCDTKVVIITKGDALHAAVGIGAGSGVVILVLVIVIIVLARRLTMKRGDTAGASRMTDISLSRTANELNKDQDNTYDEITTQNKEQTIAQISRTEANYEQLGRREVEIPHIYNTTDVDEKT
ncbi:multiple epidermal growth factor-like domains protein 10 [Mizuhopecten yessoensis]|uniref:multiple epidermal growth factor-like domains protein 10 n=1 Tax=Mizuhopecten yessoensis TaxID=6573 RepID=UPI000B45B371|nr:multiple epidermal growth factor-like domains protein 10 [Mizuhopecten yessoensis]